MENGFCIDRSIMSEPTISPFAFHSFIFSLDGKYYVQEDFQDGELWSEDEVWGSILFDLDNMKEISISGLYVDAPLGWREYISDEDLWSDMYSTENVEYYKNIIEKIKNGEQYEFD